MAFIMDYVQSHMGGFGAALILFLLSCIEVSKIEINPISDVLGFIGKKCNTDLYEKFEVMESNQNRIEDALLNTETMMKARIADIDKITENKFDSFNKKIDLLTIKHDRTEALTSRYRIIRAADEILEGREISIEHIEQLGEDIEIYKAYCLAHPEYKNHKGQRSTQTILDYEDNLFRKEAKKNYNEGE